MERPIDKRMGCLCGGKRNKIRTAGAANSSARTKSRQLESRGREQKIMARTLGAATSAADRKRKTEILKRMGKI